MASQSSSQSYWQSCFPFCWPPACGLLQRLRIPKPGAIVTVVCIAFAVLLGFDRSPRHRPDNLAGDLPQYESNSREKARSLKIAALGGGTIEKFANVLKDLQVELEQS